MKICIVDPYLNRNYRINKDTSGGYGTGNNFGSSLIPFILKKALKRNSFWPPLFVAYTFATLKKAGHDVNYLNEIPKNIDDFSFFIVTSSIVCCELEIETIKKIKLLNKKVFVIGPFASNKPELYNNAGGTVLKGEPEFYFLNKKDFDEDLNQKIVNVDSNYDLDDLPYPGWSDIIKNFENIDNLFSKDRSLPILATRGCPYSCFQYCVYPLQQGRKVRQRSVENIVAEMKYWKDKHNVKMFIFRDPVFSINKKHTMDLCNKLIDENLNINFAVETHLRILDSELIILLKKAGLKTAIVGVEGYDPEVLKNAGRFTITKDLQSTKIKELEKEKIQVSAMFIIGFPTDNNDTINKTIEYAKKLNTAYAQFSVWTPYPGTPIFEKFKDKLITNNFQNFDQYTLVYKHNLFSKNEIKKFLEKCYTSYYFRIKWLFKYLVER
tara:strand:- start:2348 stop:3661 length:1314 start_codon:yes stop_codon:yes gene_type:complete